MVTFKKLRIINIKDFFDVLKEQEAPESSRLSSERWERASTSGHNQGSTDETKINHVNKSFICDMYQIQGAVHPDNKEQENEPQDKQVMSYSEQEQEPDDSVLCPDPGHSPANLPLHGLDPDLSIRSSYPDEVISPHLSPEKAEAKKHQLQELEHLPGASVYAQIPVHTPALNIDPAPSSDQSTLHRAGGGAGTR